MEVNDINEMKKIKVIRKAFNDSCLFWMNDNELNKWYLLNAQNYWNDLFKIRKIIMLRDVLGYLGIECAKDELAFGWYFDENDAPLDNYIDFGISEDKTFMNGLSTDCILTFNVNGSFKVFE